MLHLLATVTIMKSDSSARFCKCEEEDLGRKWQAIKPPFDIPSFRPYKHPTTGAATSLAVVEEQCPTPFAS